MYLNLAITTLTDPSTVHISLHSSLCGRIMSLANTYRDSHELWEAGPSLHQDHPAALLLVCCKHLSTIWVEGKERANEQLQQVVGF